MLRKKHKDLLLLLILGCVLITGCTSQNISNSAPQEVQEEAEKAVTEEGRDTDVETVDAISRQEELPFPIGQRINAPDSFTGTVYMSSMINHEDVYNFPQTNHITFEPGARSNWHTHGGMILLVTGGVGYYQEEGKPAQIIRTGDVVECPAGVRHWHGAAPDSWFSQMVIYDSEYRGSGENGENRPVTDEEYASLDTEEYEGRNVDSDSSFMFPKGDNPTTMDTFNGPIYLSSILGDDNVAGAPGLHYVLFDPGVINNWHIHEGGQILIATDGVGYHQIEGEPVQVMHPGDVALCPPGVRHWHGGSADTSFAHIAINTNPERPGVEWFDRISDEEYEQLPIESEKQ